MTANRNFKRRVRARAAKTGESYTTALRHFRPNPMGEVMPEPKRVRLAVAQSSVREDPRSAAQLRASGAEVRRLMREAHAAGARVVHFPEGAMGWPHKRVLSVDGPDRVGPADWTRLNWPVLREELTSVAALAGELRLWTVVGAVHGLTAPHRPHNSLYVIDDRGAVVTRYDERMLSHTKISFLYTPGESPRTFEVDGVRFGLALGIEVHFAELFAEYERLDVDCVLFSSTGGAADDGGIFATEAQGHAATCGYWVSFAVSTEYGSRAPAGLIGPDGAWLSRCPADGASGAAVADIDEAAAQVATAVFRARPWRRTARAGVYDPHYVQDPRSAALDTF